MGTSNADLINKLLAAQDSDSDDGLDNLPGMAGAASNIESLLASTKDLEKPTSAAIRRTATTTSYN